MTFALAQTAVSSLTTSSLVAAVLPNDGAAGRDFRASALALNGGVLNGSSAFLPSPAAAAVAIQVQDNASPWYGYSNLTGYGTTPPLTVASADNGAVLSAIAAGTGFAGAGILTVSASTSGWPTSGTLNVVTSVGVGVVAYTGVTGSTFTGCTFVSGSTTATVATGADVTTGQNVEVGTYKLHLIPVAGDPNGSSVLQFLLPANALVITATG
jgi:hypothetical protein